MEPLLPNHLTQKEIIMLGAFYTPGRIVKLVISLINKYLEEFKYKNIVVLDSSAGYGVFLREMNNKNVDIRASEYDGRLKPYLSKITNEDNIFLTNSLINVSREKFKIPETSFLIIIGNPPYNDVTSEYKKGAKGSIIADRDLLDRDLGISFLKSYDKLKANVVCVLHPLSFIIKEANFNRLKTFKENYKLIDGIIFPSSMFYYTSRSTPFPVLVALYERVTNGMKYDYIKKFRFKILDMNKEFILESFNTTDGYINKYPPRKKQIKLSDIGLYYHSFRDINSLLRNASFMDKPHYNGIVVTLDNFYKYAYLFAFKALFKPKNKWLYGNLSPLIDIDYLENKKTYFVKYAIKNNKVLRNLKPERLKRIFDYYGIEDIKQIEKDISSIELEIKRHILSLAKI